MPSLNRIFAIIDPTNDNHRLLKRLERVAKLRGAEILAHCCIFSGTRSQDQEELKKVEINRHELWLDRLLEPLRAAGIKVGYQMAWDPEWRDNICTAANESGCDLVIKATKRKGLPGRLRKSSDWQLLRTSNIPVFLIKREEPFESAKILVAIKADGADGTYTKMNDSVLKLANEILKPYENGELHAVRAYKDWDDFINPADFAKKCDIDRTRAHSVTGHPEDAIAETANELGAEMVVMGAIASSGVTRKIFGNTVERVLDKLDCDVVTIVWSKDLVNTAIPR